MPVEVATRRKTDRGCTRPTIPCRCEKCDISFCPHCWQKFHYGTTCDEAATHVVAWHAFLSVHQDLCGALSQKAQSDFERRRRENAATAAVCRQCPHCSAGPVFKIDGVCACMRVYVCVCLCVSTLKYVFIYAYCDVCHRMQYILLVPRQHNSTDHCHYSHLLFLVLC